MNRKSPTEKEIVEVSAELLAQRTLSQLAELTELRARVRALIEELEAASIPHKDLAEFCCVVASANSLGAEKARVPTYRRELKRAFAVLARLPDIPARMQLLRALIEARARVITLERQAYDINMPVDGLVAAVKKVLSNK